MSGARAGRRLAVIGLDAGSPDGIERWAAEGLLPAIASLMRRGAWGRTTGADLISEHGVWTSLLSGVSRGRHGHYYYRELQPGTYDLHAAEALALGVPPFWAGLAGGSTSIVVLDAPDTPLVPSLHGAQIRDWATHQGWDPGRFPLVSEPPDRAQGIVNRHGGQRSTIEELDASPERDRELLGEILERVEQRGRLIRELAASERPDLLVAVFAETHAAGHQFWSYQPGLPGGRSEGPELESALPSVYQAIDRELARLLDELPEDTVVAVVSSVGLGDYFPTTHLVEEFLLALGYQVAAPRGGSSFSALGIARRLLPARVRAAASRRLSRDARERLLADAFRNGTDWPRTRAFAIPSPYTSFVRLNLRGREPEGVVEPGRDAGELLGELAQELARLTDAATGEPAVRRISITKELFGENASSNLPDMFVEWVPGRPLERIVHPRAELVNRRPDFYRRSDHVHQGFFAIAGPGVAPRTELGELEVLDVAPTLLAVLGQQPLDAMDGKPLDLTAAHGERRSGGPS